VPSNEPNPILPNLHKEIHDLHNNGTAPVPILPIRTSSRAYAATHRSTSRTRGIHRLSGARRSRPRLIITASTKDISMEKSPHFAPDQCALLLIDHQVGAIQLIKNITADQSIRNAVTLAKASSTPQRSGGGI
jgi:hypothetical protein